MNWIYSLPNLNLKTFTSNALCTICVLFFILTNVNTAYSKTILVYGDSLSAAYGMDEVKGWVNLLSMSLKDTHNVINASISGETSAGGLARLPVTLEELKPDIVILALGANDGLRGYSTKSLKTNLQSMINLANASEASVVLSSISLPSTYGPRYIDSFRAVFSDLATENNVPLLDLYQPSFLNTPGYLQDDGLHPTEITQVIIHDLVKDFLDKENLLGGSN